MNHPEYPTVLLLGTLRADGTIVLDEKPALPPGRVRLRVEPLPGEAAPEDTLAVLQHIWAENRSLGLQPRTKEEIDADIQALRDEWEEHQQAFDRLHEEANPPKGEQPC